MKQKKIAKKQSSTLTHIYQNDKNLTQINTIYPTKRVLVLYLHNNQIGKVENLSQFVHLTHLYLQWNNIRKIENLEGLRNLKQLYLGYNKLTRLENLEGLTKLEQIHVERQQLDGIPAARFEFDPDCMKSLANHLKVLNIKKLKLSNMAALEPLWKLEVLLASENTFKSTEDLTPVISALYSLRVLDLQGCVAQKDVHYREKVTAAAGHKLLLLDGKMISQSTRNFIKNFQMIKQEKKRRAMAECAEKVKTADGGTGASDTSLGSHFPANSLLQVSTRRAFCTRTPRKPVLRSPVLMKTMSAPFTDELTLSGIRELAPSALEVGGHSTPVMLQGKLFRTEVPVFKEKIRIQRKVQSLPSIE
ncbi:protein phosphatase 1 regulatory subunit 42-like [Uranotaenia lowii]|uniref:protein phosphatase 1 regulatory subunit 42-like n=1 Tax=Uranotaenia lowii TaxID=190385 RepID=UPI00247B0990|nr:protein phosphatase 1 regulatory subunit 42-like [Uranotaenia lowii]XP_055599611.1 protein phosphatase 1 regulatory subunit 42-like [Uranotaenia lowii]